MWLSRCGDDVSIHALRTEGDSISALWRARRAVSIHALRTEGDLPLVAGAMKALGFQSTPSARRATEDERGALGDVLVSIHALRTEGDDKALAILRADLVSIHALRTEGDCRLQSHWCATIPVGYSANIVGNTAVCCCQIKA